MNLVALGLLGASGLGVAGVLAALVAPQQVRPVLVGVVTACCGGLGTLAGVAAMLGQTTAIALPWLLPVCWCRWTPSPGCSWR